MSSLTKRAPSLTLSDILERHRATEGALLPLLHDVQAAFGFVSEAAIRDIASALNLTRAEVHGVVSFYHDFKTQLEEKPVIKICRSEACQARGVDALMAELPETGRVKIETVYCLGLCSVGPAALVQGDVHARLDLAKLQALVAEL